MRSSRRGDGDKKKKPPRIRHSTIKSVLAELGLKTDDRGVCVGLATMAMQAFFTDDIENFNRRLFEIDKLFHQEGTENIKKAIQAAEERIKKLNKGDHIPEEDLRLIDMKAFLHGIILGHYPKKFPDLYEPGTAPSKQVTSTGLMRQIMSKKLQDMLSTESDTHKRTFEKACEFEAMYSITELTGVLALMQHKLNSQDTPVGFMLRRIGHGMFAGYNPKKEKWVFFDANQMPATITSNPELVATKIIKGFSSLKNGFTAFRTEAWAFIPENNFELKALFEKMKEEQAFRETQTVTADRAKRVDKKGVTWLQCATKSNNVALAESLLKTNCSNISQVNYKGKSALHYAIGKQDKIIAKKILEHVVYTSDDPNIEISIGKNSCQVLIMAAGLKHYELVEYLLNKGAKTEMYYRNGDTLLCRAIQKGDYPLAKLLLENGADPNNFDKLDGESPLFLAVSEKMPEFVTLLLKHGADPKLVEGAMSISPLKLAERQGGQPLLPLFNPPNATEKLAPVKPENTSDTTLKSKK